jgi:hypothetical protein
VTERQVVRRAFHVARQRRGRKTLQTGIAPTIECVPRIARLMALAIRFDELIRTGAVSDQAELARLGHVSRARITQIMNLTLLAPDIQEALLYVTTERRAPRLSQLQPLARLFDWQEQRRLWRRLFVASQAQTEL